MFNLTVKSIHSVELDAICQTYLAKKPQELHEVFNMHTS